MTEGTKVWDLTPEECEALDQCWTLGAMKLLAELEQLKELEVKAKADWWGACVLRHRIPAALRFKLIADAKLGKIWVKGEVTDLDEVVAGGVSDNPAY
ncbi:MAG: hypothetical protein Q8O76_07755 [Chloroflexota bacterium]|nr:hypothetical protein [Chloroflexota bacterium]